MVNEQRDINSNLEKEVVKLSNLIAKGPSHPRVRSRTPTRATSKCFGETRQARARSRSQNSVASNSNTSTKVSFSHSANSCKKSILQDKQRTHRKKDKRRTLKVQQGQLPSSQSSLPVAKFRLIKQKTFITKLENRVTVKNVFDHLKQHNIVPFSILKVAPRGGFHSSFIVEVSDIDYDRLFCDEIWSNGTEVYEFRDRPSSRLNVVENYQ